MAEWNTPKTDWVTNPKSPVGEDFNRIEGNIDFLKADIETKKGAIVNALNTVGLETQLTDTHAQIANKIVAANQGTKIYTPGTANITIPKGFHSGQGYVKGDANLVPANIAKGKSIFGITGTHEAYFEAGDDLLWGTTNRVTTSSSTPSKRREIRILFNGSVRIRWNLSHGAIGIDAEGNCHGRIYKNGFPIGPERVIDAWATEWFVEDYDVKAGDLIQLYLWVTKFNPYTLTAANSEFYLKVAAPATKVQPILGG